MRITQALAADAKSRAAEAQRYVCEDYNFRIRPSRLKFIKMSKLPNILKTIGNIWIKIAIAFMVLSYCLNLIISDDPFVDRFLVFINIWNVAISILIILPGYFLREFSEKLEKK